MSYDIELIDRKTKETVLLENPFYVRGGTFRAELNPVTGQLQQAKETEAHINITYNYGRYYYEATKGDERFAHKDVSSEEIKYGIRGLYGKSARESISLLIDMINRITEKYKDENDNWIMTQRTRTHYYDENGNELDSPIAAILNKIPYTTKEETYMVCEGATSDYWEATAANAIAPLYNMIHMATDCLLIDCVWNGD